MTDRAAKKPKDGWRFKPERSAGEESRLADNLHHAIPNRGQQQIQDVLDEAYHEYADDQSAEHTVGRLTEHMARRLVEVDHHIPNRGPCDHCGATDPDGGFVKVVTGMGVPQVVCADGNACRSRLAHATRNHEAEREPVMPGRIWFCKIGEHRPLPHKLGADYPMRQAVEKAFKQITGVDPDFIFSGWGGNLTEPERAVVEDRLPDPHATDKWRHGMEGSVTGRARVNHEADAKCGHKSGPYTCVLPVGHSGKHKAWSEVVWNG